MKKEYRLNQDFSVECEVGKSMSVRVIQKSLSWEPVVEEYLNIPNKEEGNLLFKRLVEKYRTPLGFWS